MRCHKKIVSLFICYHLLLLNIVAQQLDLHSDVETAIKLKNFSKAESLLTQMLYENPKSLKSLKKRAELRMYIGNYRDASMDLTNALRLDEGNAFLYNERGDCYMKLEEYALAFVDYQKSSTIIGLDTRPFIGMAKALIAKGSLSTAKATLKSGKDLHANNHTLASLEAHILLLEGQTFKAYDILHPIYQINDKNTDVNYYLALYHLQTGEPDKAIKHCREAINGNKFFIEAYITKFKAMLELNQNKEVAKDSKDVRTGADYVQTSFRDNLQLNVIQSIAEYNTSKTSNKYHDGVALFNNFFRKTNNPAEYEKVLKVILKYTKFKKESTETTSSTPNLVGLGLACAQKLVDRNKNYDAYLNLGALWYKIGQIANAKKNLLIALDKANEMGRLGIEAEQILKKINLLNNDNKGPAIFIISPAMASARGGILIDNQPEKVTIIGTLSDDSKITSVVVNQNPAKLMQNGNFECDVYLRQDITEIKIIATDELGNQSTHSFRMKKKVEKNDAFVDLRKMFGKRKAVIFATDEYDYSWTKLNNPIFDGKELKRVLETYYGYDVEMIENPTQTQALSKLRELTKAKYNPNDQLLIFCAGHGEYDYDTKLGYVILKDSKTVDKDPERTTWVSHTIVETLLAGIGCNHVGIIIDACFSGTFDKELALARGGDGKVNNMIEYVKDKMPRKSRNFMTSGGKEYVSDGRPGKHSPFMELLLGVLNNVKGNALLSWSDICKEMKKASGINPKFGTFTNHEFGADFLLLHEEK